VGLGCREAHRGNRVGRMRRMAASEHAKSHNNRAPPPWPAGAPENTGAVYRGRLKWCQVVCMRGARSAVSLDGYIADEHHSLDWLFQFGDGEESDFTTFIGDVGVVAMGSTTYQWVLDYYVNFDPESPKPWPHGAPRGFLASRTLSEAPGGDVRFALLVVPRVRDGVA
jgi:hypothetical protein